MNPMNQMSGMGIGMNPMNGMNAMSQMNGMAQMNPMAKMQGMANGGYPPRRMSPYPSPQMHAAQKRAMYPQNVPGGPMQYPHNQTNGVPVPMQQGYGRPAPMPYGRGAAAAAAAAAAGMMPQQRPQNQPPFNQVPHGQQFYGGSGPNVGGGPGAVGAGYQNVQG